MAPIHATTLFALLLSAAALAGCAGNAPFESAIPAADVQDIPSETAPPPEPTTSPEAASPPATAPAPMQTRHQQVYSFSGLVVGASAPHPRETGPAAEQIPPAKQETFLAPAGTQALDFSVGWDIHDVGLGRVEATGPDGSLAYYSFRKTGDGFGGGCVATCSGTWTADAAGPGTYTVVYYVAGAFDLRVQVDATVIDAGAASTNSPAAPVVFAGQIVAPEPGVHEVGYCGGLVANAYQFFGPLKSGMRNVFLFDGALDGWTYAFNVDGLVADFGVFSDTLASSGKVPAGAKGVVVCSESALAVEYNLTLTPPGPIVFYGHVSAPDPRLRVPGPEICRGFYFDEHEKILAPLWAQTSDTYQLGDREGGWPYSGWSFHFNVGTMVASFQGAGPAQSSGTVPDEAYSIHVCSAKGLDTDYQLFLTPPVV